jgi:ABC-2 type transport system ATP-binding protein
VVLSSHLLDEVERTCDAVAIVDRGSVIRQGPISELLAGTAVTLQVECSEPARASALVAAADLPVSVSVAGDGLAISLPADGSREVSATIARVLVSGGISVYRLQPVHTSLESWFLQVTSRLGDAQ